jgi:hypothetical protein
MVNAAHQLQKRGERVQRNLFPSIESDGHADECGQRPCLDFAQAHSTGGSTPVSLSLIGRTTTLQTLRAMQVLPGVDAAQVGVVGLETSRPRGSYRVAFIAFPNLRSCTRYSWLVLGKFDHFTAPVAGYRLHLCRKEISSVKFDHFRHNIIPFTGTSRVT